jgi:Spy/CpxP family protein refolding chaperone
METKLARPRTTWTTWTTWMVGVALALGAVAVHEAAARPPGGGCGGGKGKGFGLERLEHRVGGLELAPDAKQAVYQVIDQARVERRALDEKIRAAHERMRELLDQDRPEAEPVLAQADSIGALVTEARKADLRAMVAIRGLLTPEQWKALHERHHHRRGHGPPDEPEA